MAAKEKPLPANVIERQQQYAELGLSDANTYKTIPELEKALIEKVYNLDPKVYAARGAKAPTVRGQTYNIDRATSDYQFEQPKLVGFSEREPQSFAQAVSNYTNAIRRVQELGAENINKSDTKTLELLARQVRDFDSPALGENAKQIITNIGDVVDSINAIRNQRELVETQRLRSLGLDKDGVTRIRQSGKELEAARGRLVTEQDTYSRLVNTANQAAPRLEESLTRFGLSDIARGIGAPVARAQQVAGGLEALSAGRVFQTGDLAGRLNSQLTDQQILSDINTARRNEYKNLYDIGTAAVTDLQSQLEIANQFLADLPEGDRRRKTAQDTISRLNQELSSARADTLQAENLYRNYQPIGLDQAAGVVGQFRESLRLPEERTLQQIREIDPQLFQSLQGISRGYQEMATTPIGATQAESTEQLRQTVEQEALNQLRLGATLGAEERRGYEQAVRAAQTARGNIFGLGPAVQEAAQIGAAGEQRKLARYGAAAQFLGSGQTMSDAMARDISLRNALEQSRLGAAAQFAAAGPSLYGMAGQRLGQQQAALGQFLAAAQPQPTQPFQATPSQMVPYAYTDPMAGFRGAQNAANIYGSLADYQARTYGAQTSAIASSYRSPGQEFASIAGGLSGFTGLFGAPGSSAFFRA